MSHGWTHPIIFKVKNAEEGKTIDWVFYGPREFVGFSMWNQPMKLFHKEEKKMKDELEVKEKSIGTLFEIRYGEEKGEGDEKEIEWHTVGRMVTGFKEQVKLMWPSVGAKSHWQLRILESTHEFDVYGEVEWMELNPEWQKDRLKMVMEDAGNVVNLIPVDEMTDESCIVHRKLLLAESEYWRGKKAWHEDESEHVELEVVVWQWLKYFLYMGTLPVSVWEGEMDVLMQLFDAASYFLIEDLKELTLSVLVSRLLNPRKKEGDVWEVLKRCYDYRHFQPYYVYAVWHSIAKTRPCYDNLDEEEKKVCLYYHRRAIDQHQKSESLQRLLHFMDDWIGEYLLPFPDDMFTRSRISSSMDKPEGPLYPKRSKGIRRR